MKLKIGIHPDQVDEESYSKRWTEALEQAGHSVHVIDLYSADFISQVKGLDGVMWRWLHTPLQRQVAQTNLKIIEDYLGIPVFPPQKISWHFDDKLAQYHLLSAVGAAIPDTHAFYKEEEALKWIATADFPKVFKLLFGASSANVSKVSGQEQAEKLVKEVFRNGIFGKGAPHTFKKGLLALKSSVKYIFSGKYPPLPHTYWMPQKGQVLFQEFLPDNDHDTRVTIIGKRAFAYIRENRTNDFRASGSGKLNYDLDRIDLCCVSMAFKVARQLDLNCIAFDFLYKDGAPVIIEISYTFYDLYVYNCAGHWDEELNWKEGKMWPQQAQIEDFVREIESIVMIV